MTGRGEWVEVYDVMLVVVGIMGDIKDISETGRERGGRKEGRL